MNHGEAQNPFLGRSLGGLISRRGTISMEGESPFNHADEAARAGADRRGDQPVRAAATDAAATPATDAAASARNQ